MEVHATILILFLSLVFSHHLCISIATETVCERGKSDIYLNILKIALTSADLLWLDKEPKWSNRSKFSLATS